MREDNSAGSSPSLQTKQKNRHFENCLKMLRTPLEDASAEVIQQSQNYFQDFFRTSHSGSYFQHFRDAILDCPSVAQAQILYKTSNVPQCSFATQVGRNSVSAVEFISLVYNSVQPCNRHQPRKSTLQTTRHCQFNSGFKRRATSADHDGNQDIL
jgi:hypothetical protein